MKRLFVLLAALALVFMAIPSSAYNTLVYTEQGGAKMVVASGGEISVESGGTLTLSGSLARSRTYQMSAGAKVGSAAGWTVNAAADSVIATCAASQTAGMLVVPINGLAVGDIITGYTVNGQIESAGGTATLDADLYSQIDAAGDIAVAAVASSDITQVSVTADTLVASAKTGLTSTVAAGTSYFVRLDCTTAGSTDIAINSITVTVTEQ